IYGAAFPGDNGIPMVFQLKGNPEYRSEELLNVEAGYRYQLGATLSVDVAAFRGRYTHGTTVEPQPPTFEFTPSPHLLLAVQYDNLLNADVEGLEMAVRWSPLSRWRLDGSYSTVYVTPDLDAGSQDSTAREFDGNAPRHQWQIHSTTDVFRRVQVDGGLYYVGRLGQLGVPAYTRADVRLEVKVTKHLSAAAVGQNLLQDAHREFSVENMGLVGTGVPRSARVQLRWQF
ncbi:MAG: TonB-dependent receptor domain-containing protein, partial [Vicinamibacterales bacterium]